MKYAIFLSALLSVGASPALADGFTPADLANAAQRADARQQELATATEQLRLAIAYDPALGFGSRAEGERTALLAVLPTGEGAGDLRVQWFMAGAIAQPSRDATTLLYNPLARGALALDWVKTADGWQVAHAWLSSSGPATWPVQDAPWRKAFVEDYASARAAPGDAGAEWVPFETDRWLGGLAAWLTSPANKAASDDARKRIATGKTGSADGGNIDLISERARETYAPAGAIARQDGGQAVIYASPIDPQMLIAADFSAGAKPRLEKLSLINLGNVGESK